jgi:ribulose-phosphate 3-epimerase
VPNLSFGPPVVRDLRRGTKVPFDLHLMVENPETVIDDYLALAPTWLSVHWEAVTHLDRLSHRVRDAGVGFGVALNPATPVEWMGDILPLCDFVLLMSVNPGFAGQSFLPYVLDKARRLRGMIAERGTATQIEMDGGVATQNLEDVRDVGVDVAVIGSGIFAAANPLATLADLISRGGAQTGSVGSK